MEFLEVYQKYKEWWLEKIAPNSYAVLHQNETEDEAFRIHVDNHSLYEFIELMESWSYE